MQYDCIHSRECATSTVTENVGYKVYVDFFFSYLFLFDDCHTKIKSCYGTVATDE
jgi:hypothetical protein